MTIPARDRYRIEDLLERIRVAGAGPDLLPAPAGERELHLAIPPGTREASSGAPADLVIHVHLHFGGVG